MNLTDEQVQNEYEEFADWFHWKYQKLDESLYLCLEEPCFLAWLKSRGISITKEQLAYSLLRDKGV